jgi:hypothetical protein
MYTAGPYRPWYTVLPCDQEGRMITVQYNPAFAPHRPTCNKLAPGVRPQSSSVASNYDDSADWSQIREIPLVDIDPLDPSALASRTLAASSPVPILPFSNIAKRTYGTAKIGIKQSKSTPQRGATSEQTTKFSNPAAEIGCFWQPAVGPALLAEIRNPASEIRHGALVRVRPARSQRLPTSDNVESV